MQTIIFRMDKQQGPTVYHRELYLLHCDKSIMGKSMKNKKYICIAESLCCTAGINTTMQINYTSIKLKTKASCRTIGDV